MLNIVTLEKKRASLPRGGLIHNDVVRWWHTPGDSGAICFNKFRAREEEKIEHLHDFSVVLANFQYNNQLDIVF